MRDGPSVVAGGMPAQSVRDDDAARADLRRERRKQETGHVTSLVV